MSHFFHRDTVIVAEELLGKVFVWHDIFFIITETEAYRGDDEACHAFNGETPRNAPLFGEPGTLYVYFTYGMHHCMNIVTEPKGRAGGVLIRAGFVLGEHSKLYNGPAKLTKNLGITREHNGVSLVNSDCCGVYDYGKRYNYSVTPRIGISRGQEKPWRFVIDYSFMD